MRIQNLGDKLMSGGGSRSAVPHFDYFRDCDVGNAAHSEQKWLLSVSNKIEKKKAELHTCIACIIK
jgi:hypothetical protein